MSLYNQVEIDDISLLGLEDSIFEYTEMTRYDLSFLFALIREVKPRTILEIGVAAGGTTSAILQYLNNVRINCKMVSVDYSVSYYRDEKKKTGFVASKWIENNNNIVDHEFILGKTVAECISDRFDKVENRIDFLILDTMHIPPGEILDFLVCYPYMSKNACVVLHDVGLHLKMLKNPDAMATFVLFNSLKGKKYYSYLNDGSDETTNIGAIMITEETCSSIADVFMSLLCSWSYFPAQEQIIAYSQSLRDNYSDGLMKFYYSIIDKQKKIYCSRKVLAQKKEKFNKLITVWAENDEVYLFGAGNWAEVYYHFAMSQGFALSGFVVSNDEKIVSEKKEGFEVVHVNRINKASNPLFVIAVQEKYIDECRNNILKEGFSKII